LGNLLNGIADVDHYMPKTENYGVPYVMTGDLKDYAGDIDFDSCKKISYDDYEKLSKKVRNLKGDIILARYATVGTVSYVNIDFDFVVSYSCVTIKPDKSRLIDLFLYYYFKSNIFRLEVKNIVNANIQDNVGIGDLVKMKIPLPPTKAEQTTIATALSDTDSLICSLENLIAKKRNIKQGAMQKLLQPKEGWDTKTLKEVAKYRRGSFPQPYGLDKWYDGSHGLPFVQVYDVDDNFRLKSETKRKISKEAQEMSVFIEKGSIIITLQGSIGRIAITQYDAYVDRTLLFFESFLVPFDKYFFLLSIFQLFEKEKEKAPGGIIKTITKEALSSFTISYPKIEEQSRIATILLDMNAEIAALETKLEKYRNIKLGMMQNLLTGKIRLV
jgi:type I restriction enzyme S subunit